MVEFGCHCGPLVYNGIINSENQMKLTRLEELQSYYSDFYKDVHGFRPRFDTTENWNSEVYLEDQIKGLHDYLEALDKTEAGRAELRTMGFSTSDKEADQAHQDAEREYYNRMAAEDAQHYADCAVLDILMQPKTPEEWAQEDAEQEAAEERRNLLGRM